MYLKFAYLPVDDVDRAIAFYTGKLRLQLTTDAALPDGGRWVELAMPEGRTSLLIERRRSPGPGERPALVIIVPDVEMTFERLDALGVTFVAGPAEAAWEAGTRYAIFLDSEGNQVVVESGPPPQG